MATPCQRNGHANSGGNGDGDDNGDMVRRDGLLRHAPAQSDAIQTLIDLVAGCAIPMTAAPGIWNRPTIP